MHQAIGFCSLELQDFAQAEANLDEALVLNERLGRPIEVLKIEMGRGRLLIRRGNYALGIYHLRPVRRREYIVSLRTEPERDFLRPTSGS